MAGLLAGAVPVPAQETGGTIMGVVTTTETGQVLAGATVQVEGTQLGAFTNERGLYRIAGVPAGTYELVATLIGYGSLRRSVTVAAGETATVDFALQAQAVQLDEIVVIGYGTQRRRNVTSAISSISGEELERSEMVTVEDALLGRAPGVQVVTSSGQPGAGAAVRIRGGNSIGAGNDPLYVVDGVPITSNTGDTNAGGLIGGGTMVGNPLATLNPNDIASIDILKDASATAIYGARGANGVILITTKQGGASADGQLDVSISYGVQQVRRTLPLLGAQEFAELVNEAYVNTGNAPLFTPEQVAAFGEGTDWQDEIFRTAPVENYHASFVGGTNETRVFVSGNVLQNQGVIEGSEFQRGAFRLNLDQLVGERARLGSRLAFSRTEADILANTGAGNEAASVVLSALRAPPFLSPYDASGEFYDGINPVTGRAFSNPLATALAITNTETQNRFLGNVFGEYDVLPGLVGRVSLGLDYINSAQEYYAPRDVTPGSLFGGQARRGQALSSSWLNENTLTYTRGLGELADLELLGGFTYQRAETEVTGMEARGFLTDALGADAIGTGATRQDMYSDEREWTLVSYLSRAQLGFVDGRYLVTLAGRVDGSSRFGEGNKYGFFPSVAAAWRMSDEPFVQDLGLFSDLKLRASYGQTGNQEIGLYQSLARLQSVSYVLDGARQIGFVPNRLANTDLKWETTNQYDVGIEMGFLENRLALTADAYYKKTTDLLLDVVIPLTSGAGNLLSNIGSVENRGVELAVRTINLDGPVRWTSSLNLGMNRNEVLDLGERDEIINPVGVGAGAVQNPTILRVGEPINSFYGYRFAGLNEEGRPTFEDVNGDGAVTSEDKVILGNAEPDYVGGLTNQLTWRGFDLSVFLQWSVGNEVYNINRSLLTNTKGDANQLEDVLETGRVGIPLPRADNTFNNAESDLFVEDGSYLRGKNIRLGYTVGQDRLASLPGLSGLSGLTLYVSAQNFFTITDYSGFDPEITEYVGSNLAQGIDFGTYPQTRQFTFGITAGL